MAEPRSCYLHDHWLELGIVIHGRTIELCLIALSTVALAACTSVPTSSSTPNGSGSEVTTATVQSQTPIITRYVSTVDATAIATATLTAEPARVSPTLDPLRNIPETGAITSTYIVRRGDTLSGIAVAVGATISELQKMNAMVADADVLKAGQVIQIHLPIKGHAPSIKLIPDSELVNSPTAIQFDMASFMSAHPLGYLNHYTETVEGVEMTGPRIVSRVAEQFSVHPRILLALLEYTGGWVDDPAPVGDRLKYPLGYVRTNLDNLNVQLNWAAARLNEGYYGWRLATRLWVRLEDGVRAFMGNGINAGTAGLQSYIAAISTSATWLNILGNGPQGVIQTYKRLFGDPWKYDLGQLIPDNLQQLALALPWAKGETWLFTGGPHSAWGTGSPWGALDFTSMSAYGCNELDDWVTAMIPGVIARSFNGEVVESLDSSGDEHTGWSILYMHIRSDDRVKVGDRVKAGDHIGHPSCEGGVTNGSHVHLARKYNGEWLNAAGAIPFIIGGWKPSEGDLEYDGSITNGSLTRTPCECKELYTNGVGW
jgi:LasA protease